MLARFAITALLLALATATPAATFNVNTPAEFQTALTTAQANGASDTINVAAGTYNIAASGTLTYVPPASENFGLSIVGADSDLVTLDGGMQVPILRIDTTAVISDQNISIEVTNMTLQNGNATGTFDDGGALAILMDDGQLPAEFSTLVSVRGSEFYTNRADDDGGAIYIRAHAVEGIYLEDLTIQDNQATGNGGGAFVAGGVFTTPIFFNDIDFFDNTAQTDGGGLYAGGFDASTASERRAQSVTITLVEFFDNVSASTSGGGGGADVGALNTTLRVVGFVDNQANEGGGMRLRPNWSSFSMLNSGFINNQSVEDGGGLLLRESGFVSATITNNTFFENSSTGSASRGAGAFIAVDGSSSVVDIYNNIIYANISGGEIFDDLFIDNRALNDIASTVNIFNNDIRQFTVSPGPVNTGDNIDQNPMFVDITLRPLPNPRLMAGSPAIDSGLNTAPGAPDVDFEGDTRPIDGNNDAVATIDMGLDEASGAIVPNADLALTKTDDADPVTEGGDITYTMVVTNNGPGGASNVTLVDSLSMMVSYVSATSTQGSCSESMATVTCNIGSLANNASATVTLVVTTPDVLEPLDITNLASVSATEPDPNMGDNNASEVTRVVPMGPAMADVALTKAASPNPVFSGGPQLTYSLTVNNNGPDDASNVVVTDTLPAGVGFDSATASVGTCTEVSGVVSCALGGLAVQASSTVTIVVTPDVVTEPATITNTADVSASEEDPTPANNSVMTDTLVNPPSADVSLSVTSTPSEPIINEQITYAFTVGNAGPSDDTGAVLTVALPEMATFVSAVVDQGSCAQDEGTVTCTIGDLPFGTSIVATIVVTAPSQAMTLSVNAAVTADIADPESGNNTISEDLDVIDVIDLVIQGKSEGSGSLGPVELLFLLLLSGGVIAIRRRHQWLRQNGRAFSATIAVTALSVLLVSVNANAQDEWYVGATFGWTNLDYSAGDLTGDLLARGWTINNANVDDSNTSYKLFVGYEVNEWFAVEAGYVDLGEVVTQFGATIAPNRIDDLLNDTLSVHPYLGDGFIAAGVVRWPFAGDRWSVVGRLGLFAWESDTTVRVISGGAGRVGDKDSGTDIMYGVGVELMLNDRWALTADWERYKLNEWLDVPSIGVVYRF